MYHNKYQIGAFKFVVTYKQLLTDKQKKRHCPGGIDAVKTTVTNVAEQARNKKKRVFSANSRALFLAEERGLFYVQEVQNQ